MNSTTWLGKIARTAIAAVVAAGATLLCAPRAQAQANPTFTYAKPEDVVVAPEKIEWKAQAKGGLLVTTGNSQGRNGNFGVTASRKQGGNKLSLDGAIAYGQSDLWTPAVSNSNQIVGLDRKPVTTTNNWNSKVRYDRFLTPNNSIYLSGLAAADRVAGKSFFGGGQIGYSRQLLKNALHLVVAELGYDLSHERYLPQANRTIDPVTIHSARVFVGETLKLNAVTGVTASVEALFNLNKEATALNAGNNGQPGVDAFKDTRLVGKVGLTTTLVKSLSFGFGFTLRYDQNPAPLAVSANVLNGRMYSPTFTPFSTKLDTATEATLIYTFL
jgi:hypothetical protein